MQAVEELSRKDEEGIDGRQVSQLEIRQHVEMQLFGKSITAPMRLHLKADHAAQQVSRSLLCARLGSGDTALCKSLA